MELDCEKAGDKAGVEALLDLCFGATRGMLSSYQMRAGVDAVAGLCFVLREAGGIVGAIRYWPVCVGSGRADALLLGPIAVHPVHQGEGLGGMLIRHSLTTARSQGWARVILIGDASYYGRFGFVRGGLEFPPPTDKARILVLGLIDGAWEGVDGAVVRFEG